MQQPPDYATAVFLLSADEELWDTVSKNVLDTGIYFDRVRLGGVECGLRLIPKDAEKPVDARFKSAKKKVIQEEGKHE